jgi:hypothetical protein
MENCKIFAMPDVYELLSSKTDGEKTKSVLQDLINQLTKNDKRHCDSYDKRTSLGISALWSRDDSKPSVILLYKSEILLGLKHSVYPETFWEDISKATAIDFV